LALLVIVSRYGVNKDAWKTLWIFQVGGSLSQYIVWEMAAVTRKGPYCCGASLAVGCVVDKFLASSHTQSSTQ
jgi:hypothetical protein